MVPTPIVTDLLSDVTIRRRDIHVKIHWTDLQRLIAQTVMESIGVRDDALPTDAFKIDIMQNEEGSPSYRVSQWSAVVKLSLPID